tara:strand:- start:47 stop:445 length:399 start_codon:yes stop_codon:yes gene_type:complete
MSTNIIVEDESTVVAVLLEGVDGWVPVDVDWEGLDDPVSTFVTGHTAFSFYSGGVRWEGSRKRIIAVQIHPSFTNNKKKFGPNITARVRTLRSYRHIGEIWEDKGLYTSCGRTPRFNKTYGFQLRDWNNPDD